MNAFEGRIILSPPVIALKQAAIKTPFLGISRGNSSLTRKPAAEIVIVKVSKSIRSTRNSLSRGISEIIGRFEVLGSKTLIPKAKQMMAKKLLACSAGLRRKRIKFENPANRMAPARKV